MSTNIRLLKDGDRMIIVIDGADKTVAEAVNNLITMFLANQQSEAENESGNEANATGGSWAGSVQRASLRSEVPGLEPVPMVEINIPTEAEIERMETIAEGESITLTTVSGGIYAGETPADALYRDGIKALAELFEYVKDLPQNSSEKDMICSICKTYLSGSFEIEASRYTSREERLEFLETAAKITPINSLANGLGLMEYDRFKDFASDDNVEQLYKTVVASLVQRGN